MSGAGPDHYVVLGVPQDATVEEIRRAYRAIALRLHPDVSELADNEPMAAANEAWHVLGDASRRTVYDQRIGSSPTPDTTISGAESPIDDAPVPRRAGLLLLAATLMCAVVFVLIVLIGFSQGPGAAP